MSSSRDTPDAAVTTTVEQDAARENWVRGYLEGHEQGSAEAAAIAATVQQLRAAAWNLGYDAGHRDGIAETREDVGQTITDLSAQYAEIDAAWKHFGRITREQRVTAEMAEMKARAAKLHAQVGTTEWIGLENGAVLPSADWAPSTAALTAKADQALALARRHPSLASWAQVRAYVDDRVWVRILDDLKPGQRQTAIRQAGSMTRNGAAA